MGAAISIMECFAKLEDPRVTRTRLHSLDEILTITLCALLCGIDTWTGVELFGNLKKAWLKSFLPLPNGIPSHDTIGRVFAALDPKAFSQGFSQWVRAMTDIETDEVIAIDGKSLFDACRAYLESAQALVRRARELADNVHGGSKLTRPPDEI